MIEIEHYKERNLKNLKQIGTPKEENKIYIEQTAYEKIKEMSYKEKRVFILMGHTEKMEGRYITFIEGAIRVREIDFHGNVPRWNNSTWGEIFREIKKQYESMIIVGWAIDLKGMAPKVTPELERAHREHFGGVHQLLFLLDTIEQEECFYIYKENRICPKDGFYIYQKAKRKEEVAKEKREPVAFRVLDTPKSELQSKTSHVELEVDVGSVRREQKSGGRYRQLINAEKEPKRADEGNLGIAIAVAMLIFVIGIGIYEDRDKIFGTSNSIETNQQNGLLYENEEDKEMGDRAEVSEGEEHEDNKSGGQNTSKENSETEEPDEDAAVDVIPVDVIPGTTEEK